jgi:hypothetical protein
MSIGPCVVGIGMALLTRSPNSSSYVVGVLPGVVVLALGLATTVAPLTATALSSAPDNHSGVASAVNNCVARLGSLIAVAAIPALAGITRASYLHANQLAVGFRHATFVAGGLSVLSGLMSAVLIRNPESRTGRRTPEGKVSPVPLTTCALDAAPLVASVPVENASGPF